MRISYANVFGLHRTPGPGEDSGELIAVGDLVATGRNKHPRYRVIALDADKAWIRGVSQGRDHVVPVSRLRKLPPAEEHA